MVCARIWEEKDRDVKRLIAGEYRIEIIAPELTPRDTLELASTAINLVQNRLWSAERAMDRVGVEDPIGSPSFTVFGALWDTAVWDVDVWAADGEQVTQQWIGVHALGRCAAVRMKMASQGATMAVSAFDVLLEPAQATAL